MCKLIIPSIVGFLLLTIAAAPGCRAHAPHAGKPVFFPFKAPIAGALDIAVSRDGFDWITVENRTAGTWDNATLWLNNDWGMPLKQLPIGQTIHLPLKQFINQYSESYPTGNLLEPRKSKPLIRCNLEHDGKMYNLITVPQKNWQKAY